MNNKKQKIRKRKIFAVCLFFFVMVLSFSEGIWAAATPADASQKESSGQGDIIIYPEGRYRNADCSEYEIACSVINYSDKNIPVVEIAVYLPEDTPGWVMSWKKTPVWYGNEPADADGPELLSDGKKTVCKIRNLEPGAVYSIYGIIGMTYHREKLNTHENERNIGFLLALEKADGSARKEAADNLVVKYVLPKQKAVAVPETKPELVPEPASVPTPSDAVYKITLIGSGLLAYDNDSITVYSGTASDADRRHFDAPEITEILTEKKQASGRFRFILHFIVIASVTAVLLFIIRRMILFRREHKYKFHPGESI
jgi:hypothetical protein